jgi:hypothetical protein
MGALSLAKGKTPAPRSKSNGYSYKTLFITHDP